MRVLFLVRENLTTHPGGDTVQVLQTAAALRTRGHDVTLSSAARPALTGHDVVHLFHLDRLWETVGWCRQLRHARVPAVLSTIYWPPDEFDRGGRRGWQGRLARLAGSGSYRTLRIAQRGLIDALRGGHWTRFDHRLLRFRSAVRYVFDTVRVLLPNSAAERDAIAAEFGAAPPAVIVPNAVDLDTFGPPAGADERAGRHGVLCVGRLEPRKNQLALIRALRDTDTPLTFIGQAGRYSRDYAEACRLAAGPLVTFAGPADAPRLRDAYRAAAVHACPSWYETPGLASLEAALCGCALVVTPGGSTREYFGDEAHYARPDDDASLGAAVAAALAAGPPPTLPTRVAAQYTWAATAAATEAAYQQAVC